MLELEKFGWSIPSLRVFGSISINYFTVGNVPGNLIGLIIGVPDSLNGRTKDFETLEF